jgi:hypothetical protein
MRSWTDRARMRGDGLPIVRPGPEWRGHEAWHVLIDEKGDQRAMRWRPGLECWFDAHGNRVNAEDAGKRGWSYHAPSQRAVTA